MTVLLVLAAIVPPLLILWYFHVSDRYPEPSRVIWKSFLLGAATVVPVMLLETIVNAANGLSGPWAKGSFEAFMVAALPEELAKFWVLSRYCRRRAEFDEPMDGLVYGSAVALGFASVENVFYVLAHEGGVKVALLRALTAVPSHGAMGAIMGYFIALSCYLPRRRIGFLLLALAVPTLLHGLYDATLMIGQYLPHGDAMVGPLFLTFLALVATEFYLVAVLLKEFKRLQQSVVEGEPPVWCEGLRGANQRLRGWLSLLTGGFALGLSAIVTSPSKAAWVNASYPILRLLAVVLAIVLLVQGWRIVRRRQSDRGDAEA